MDVSDTVVEVSATGISAAGVGVLVISVAAMSVATGAADLTGSTVALGMGAVVTVVDVVVLGPPHPTSSSVTHITRAHVTRLWTFIRSSSSHSR
jgi:hypothetical protein